MAERPGPAAGQLGYEPRDVSIRLVLVTVLGGLLFVGCAAAALYGLDRLYAGLDLVTSQPPPSALERRTAEPPPPRLQTDPAAALAEYRSREAAILGSYAWADKKAGIARIPIERAMQLLAERGWPDPAAPREDLR